MERLIENKHIKRRILIVDDENINRMILSNILGPYYTIDTAENGKQAFDMLKSGSSKYSLILLDLMMPVMTGFELMELCTNDEPLKNIPIIVMTSENDSEVRCIKMGASDFIKKPYDMPEVILARVDRIIKLFEDTSIIRSTERDSLTGLYTKDFFVEYIKRIETNDSEPMDIIMIDIDQFHLINEIYGNIKGNEVLKVTANAIFSLLDRQSGIACRSDADSFFIYLTHCDDYDAILKELDEMLSRVTISNIRVNMGVYQNSDRNIDIQRRLGFAKIACNSIKKEMKRISFYSDELYKESVYKERLISDMRIALDDQDFTVYYQPKYDITKEKPVLSSAEALVRWEHKELGMIPPCDFIPLFEQYGLIGKLDQYVWKQAAVQIKEWKEKYGIEIPVSVNVSRVDIYDEDLLDTLSSLMKDNGLTNDDLYLEITESACVEDTDHLISTISSIKAEGFTIELDDFGAGYSSLNMLTLLPIDVLKIDMKFIRNMESDKRALKLISFIIDIAKSLNLKTVAEGVETKEQMETLKDMGCDLIQGYYFSRPLPPKEFEKLIIKD